MLFFIDERSIGLHEKMENTQGITNQSTGSRLQTNHVIVNERTARRLLAEGKVCLQSDSPLVFYYLYTFLHPNLV